MIKKDNIDFTDKQQVAGAMGPLLASLTTAERAELVEAMQVFTFERRQNIFAAGNVPQYIYYLLSGYVTIYQEGVGGRRQLVRMVEPGAVFGSCDSFANEPYKSTAVAGCNLAVAAMPLELVYHLVWENGAFATFFIHDLANLLGTSITRTISLTQKHIRARLADTLLALQRRYGMAPDGVTISVALGREDLALMSNMTTSNAIRTLSAFADDGLIDIRGRCIALLKPAELARISEAG